MTTHNLITGNIGAAPELTRFSNGKIKAVACIATDSKDQEGNKTTIWYRANLWGRDAERAADLLTKGTKVHFDGQVIDRQYIAKDGSNRTCKEIAVKRFFLLATKAKV